MKAVLRIFRVLWRHLVFRPRKIWLGLLTPLLLLAIFRADGALSPHEAEVVAAILEILGLGLIALGYANLRVRFGRPAPLMVLRQFWREFVRDLGGPRVISVQANAGGIAIVGGRARAVVRPGPHATAERRLELLEKRVDEADAEIERVESALNKESEALKRDVATLATELRSQVKEVRVLTEESAIGDVGIEVVGWLWLFSGTLLAAMPAASLLLRGAP